MLYHHNPHQWPSDQGHGLWHFTLKFLFKVFFLLFCYENNLGRYVVGLWSALWHWIVGREVKVSMTHISWSVICLISWRLFDVWPSYFGIMSKYDLTCDLKINVGHCDLYFMVQWFCLISWRLYDVWTSYFRIMSQYNLMFDLKINVDHCDLYFIVQWFCLIFWRLLDVRTPY